MNITDFLHARIKEDETAARNATESPWVGGIKRAGEPGRWRLKVEAYLVLAKRDRWIEGNETVAETSRQSDREHIARHDPARVLAECAAKRAIIAEWEAAERTAGGYPTIEAGYAEGLAIAVEHLAAIYSDHPDYNEEWRPTN